MLIGRESEQNVLDSYYNRTQSQLMVMYGKYGVGKSALLQKFEQTHPHVYNFKLRAVSNREQLFDLSLTLKNKGIILSEYPDFHEFFSSLINQTDSISRPVLIFDEFQYLCKNDTSFFDSLFDCYNSSGIQFFIILCSSSLEWIENSFIKKLGPNARMISSFLKVRELGFHDFKTYFSKFSQSDAIRGYSILGGVPLLWHYFDPDLILEENIIQNILKKNTVLQKYGENMVSSQLRETAIYNTLLINMASGRRKLKDLYEHTGFSRAKISVYIKNLMQLGLCEKLYSVEATSTDANSIKGMYDISDAYVDFTYHYLFKMHETLKNSSAKEFYYSYIEPTLTAYTEKYFVKICKQYMETQNIQGKLPVSFTKLGSWNGKMGTIDIVAEDDDHHMLIGLCNWENPYMHYEDYEWMLFCAKKAKFSYSYIYLFSFGGFDPKIIEEQKNKSNIKLVSSIEL